jgi:hypothetical protein
LLGLHNNGIIDCHEAKFPDYNCLLGKQIQRLIKTCAVSNGAPIAPKENMPRRLLMLLVSRMRAMGMAARIEDSIMLE